MFGPRRLKELARQLGYGHRTHVSIDDAGAFERPPWGVEVEGARNVEVREVLHRQSEQGLFMLGDFMIDPGGDGPNISQTVAGARLNARPPGLERFISKLQLPKGLHCVMRGDCVYLFASLYAGGRSSRFSTTEAAACLEALSLMANGDYPGAFRQLSSIPGSSMLRAAMPWAFVAAVWAAWAYAFMTYPEMQLGLMLVGAGAFVFLLFSWWLFQERTTALRSYADRRVE